MKSLFYCLLLSTLLYSCKKEETKIPPDTLSEAGYANEIDTYHPGTYWVYAWKEFDMTGSEINSGTDTIAVSNDTSVAGQRTLTGTVNGHSYTGNYQINNQGVTFQGNSGTYFLYAQTRVLFDSTQIITDHSLNGPERGCNMYLNYANRPNVGLQTDAGVFITVEAKQNTSIANDNGGCESGYELVNYIPRVGEAYRETSWANSSNYNYRIRFTRSLIAYHIAH
ncbi:MAG TPA: hypothetical protein VK154_10115 [Chitinophagales bacterium]|nr:hypothetical protein [Chitinophagales bacterium]